MEMNKDDADKCLDIATAAASAGNFEKALRFYKKSDSLFPSAAAKGGMRRAEIGLAGGPSPTTAGPSRPSSTSAPRPSTSARPAPSAPAKKDDSPPIERPHTPAMAEEVRRVRSTKCYYEMLKINKDGTADEIRKSYRKIVLRLHPDKNTAPGSEEAFKKVTQAVECLGDEDRRAHYDQFGRDSDDPDPTHQMRRQRHPEWNNLSPEEIFFREFFGANVYRYHNAPFGFRAAANPRRRTADGPRTRGEQAQAGAQGSFPFMQLLPLIVLLMFSVMSTPGTREPSFSLAKSDTFVEQRLTLRGKVPYYVKANFDEEHGKNLSQLDEVERQVVQSYWKQMQSSCYYEKQEKRWLVESAKSYRGSERTARMTKANEYVMRGCLENERLRKIFNH